jgi:site-specific DNA-cytosine methylase
MASLAGHALGFETVLFCEIDKNCQNILKLRFPGVAIHDDLTTLSKEKTKAYGWKDKYQTVVTCGFPCQPYSVAGYRRGASDDRDLTGAMLNYFGEIQADFIVAENVAGLLSNENGSTINAICTDLENIGYQKPIILDITADTLGLSTMERHIWIIAANNKIGCQSITQKPHQNRIPQMQLFRSNKGNHTRWHAPESRVLRVGEGYSRRMDRYRVQQIGNSFPPIMAYQVLRPIYYFLTEWV